MPYNQPRNNLSGIPEVMWDSGLKEMNETWKGVIACFGVVVFLLMTIGIIYWQVVDQPNTNWILRSSTSGLIWDRKDHSLILQTLKEERNLLKIHMRGFPDVEIPFIKNICWQNQSEFCYTWEAIVELKIFLDSNSSPNSECYNINWTPLHCQVKVKVTNYSFSSILLYSLNNFITRQIQLWWCQDSNDVKKELAFGQLRFQTDNYRSKYLLHWT